MRVNPAILLVGLVSGCVAGRPYPAPNLLTETFTVPDVAPAKVLRPVRSALVLSSGGANGAYATGLLCGWSESGKRPEFDVVTGVSTGALIAPFAFLGPDYDDNLKRLYLGTGQRDIFSWRPPLLVLWKDSLADPRPLQKRIEAEVTDGLLAQIATEHRQGRRLYVSTTDLDNRRQVVWDLGAIAASSDPERRKLFCDVLLASCSVPVAFPPVPINVEVNGQRRTELHADGSIIANTFLPPIALGVSDGQVTSKLDGQCNVYVVLNSRLAPARKSVDRRILPVMQGALDGILATQQGDDLLKLFLLCQYAGAEYHLTAIPDELSVDGAALAFEPQMMRSLYHVGRQAGLRQEWSSKHPALHYDAQPVPRGGRQLKVLAPESSAVPKANPPVTASNETKR